MTSYGSTVGKDELRKVLEAIFKVMQKNGMLPSEMSATEKNDILDTATEELGNNCKFTMNELQTPDVKKRLYLCISAACVQNKDKTLELDFKKIFDRGDVDDNVMKAFLGIMALDKNNKLEPSKRLTPEKLLEKAEKALEEAMKEYDKDFEITLKNNAPKPEPVDYLALALENLYGGIDPRIAGGFDHPVFMEHGNVAGIADTSGNNATSTSSLDNQNNFDNKADPLGMKNTVRERMDSLCNVIEDELTGENALSSAPKPNPNH